jgi:hypothetical protein
MVLRHHLEEGNVMTGSTLPDLDAFDGLPLRPSDDVIDSRQVTEALWRLQRVEPDHPAIPALAELDAWGATHLRDWHHGVELVNERAWLAYHRTRADEEGLLNDLEWPFMFVDWAAAAASVRHQYDEVDWQGFSFLGLA